MIKSKYQTSHWTLLTARPLESPQSLRISLWPTSSITPRALFATKSAYSLVSVFPKS